MASSTPSTLTLSSVLSQELNPITCSISLKPKPLLSNSGKNFSLFPLVLQLRERKTSAGHWTAPDGSFSKSLVVAAVAEAEVSEDVAEQDVEGEGGVAVSAPPKKPRKGKAALPLKRDRVCLQFIFCCFVNLLSFHFIFGFIFWECYEGSA